MKQITRQLGGLVPYVLSFLCVLSFATLAHAEAAFPKLAAKIAAKEPVTVVCFGDSVTGAYYHTGGRRAYTNMVEIGLDMAWPDSDITAINAGISGHTTVNALARIDKDVLAHKPDLVTVMFGLNDMTRVPLEEYRANLKTIVDKCRAIGAEVMLCTPNSVTDTSGRPTATLLTYVAVVREVAAETKAPLADCYEAFEAVRAESSFEWAMLMSDEIHPNMGGHKQIAKTIVATATGKAIELGHVPGPPSVLSRTAARIAAKDPIKVLAIPPYDAILERFLTEFAPESTVTVERWDVADQTVTQIKEAAKGIRDKKYDLVFIAVPAAATAKSPEAYLNDYGWILSFSLSFGFPEWDVVAVPPSLAATLEGEDVTRDEWQKRLIRAQDFFLIEAGGGSEDAAQMAVRGWMKEQLGF